MPKNNDEQNKKSYNEDLKAGITKRRKNFEDEELDDTQYFTDDFDDVSAPKSGSKKAVKTSKNVSSASTVQPRVDAKSEEFSAFFKGKSNSSKAAPATVGKVKVDPNIAKHFDKKAQGIVVQAQEVFATAQDAAKVSHTVTTAIEDKKVTEAELNKIKVQATKVFDQLVNRHKKLDTDLQKEIKNGLQLKPVINLAKETVSAAADLEKVLQDDIKLLNAKIARDKAIASSKAAIELMQKKQRDNYEKSKSKVSGTRAAKEAVGFMQKRQATVEQERKAELARVAEEKANAAAAAQKAAAQAEAEAAAARAAAEQAAAFQAAAAAAEQARQNEERARAELERLRALNLRSI